MMIYINQIIKILINSTKFNNIKNTKTVIITFVLKKHIFKMNKKKFEKVNIIAFNNIKILKHILYATDISYKVINKGK